MEEWQIEHITKNLKELTEMTRFNSIVKAQLVAQNVLCKADLEELDAKQKQYGDMEASRLYYQKLLTRNNAYKVLYTSLVETNQSGAYTVLIRVPNKLFAKPLTYLEISAELKDFKDVNIEANGKTFKLHEFFLNKEHERLQEVFKRCLNEMEIYDTFVTKEKKFVLANNTIPTKPPFYIPRFISNRIQLNESIFKTLYPDIFVFKDSIPRYKLSTVARPNSTDTSSSQLTRFTCRFIHLEDYEDWDKLKKLAKVPIHLIKYEATDNQYLLEDTTSVSDILRTLGSRVERVYMTEEYFVGQQASADSKPSSVCICDTPGMGKTFLLANIARFMTENCTGRIIVMIELTVFVTKFCTEFGNDLSETETSLKCVLSYISVHPELLIQLVKDKLLVLEIFFDGFDEIPSDKVEWTKKVFKSIITNFPNVRIYITSRPHMRQELESSLGVVAYDILPFNRENQVDFLVQHWHMNIPNSEQLSLRSYANLCLESINKSLSQNEKEIAGIPLLCQLIAEVYVEKVVLYAFKRRKFSDTPLKISEMYKKFIENKIKFVAGNKMECDNLRALHVWHARKLLLPINDNQKVNHLEHVEDMLMYSKILKAGILQKNQMAL